MALSTFLHLKRLQWVGHTGRMDDPCVPQKVMGCFRGKNPMRRPTGRWEDAVWMDAEDLRFESEWSENRMMMMIIIIIIMGKEEKGAGEKKSSQYLLSTDNTLCIRSH